MQALHLISYSACIFQFTQLNLGSFSSFEKDIFSNQGLIIIWLKYHHMLFDKRVLLLVERHFSNSSKKKFFEYYI